MSEKKTQFEALGKLMVCVVFAFLYAIGGSESFGGIKELRRFVAPTILGLAMFGFSRDWKSLIQIPLMFGSLSLGYGGDTLGWKLIRRSMFGSANGITSSLYNILRKKWLLVGTQIILLWGLYIVMGVWNPLPDARHEELFLGFMVAYIPLMSLKRKQ